ncbi:hypothetical protein [Sorangium cellulosum]|uniref:hypothetical protein n=1 Tax=Sorangium cellulosum TaxID=56 RepID=UPI0010129327|nr:hypothetical protein [Sorangium cellulosum]
MNGQASNGIWAYYGIKNQADGSGEPAIGRAPSQGTGIWDQRGHVLFGDLLALVQDELCVDITRVIAAGFSFEVM